MSAIKEFFKKKKLDIKFKKAGQGHKLTEQRAAPTPQNAPMTSPRRSSQGLTEQQQRAAEAALARSSSAKAGQ